MMTSDTAVLSVDFELFTQTPAYRSTDGPPVDPEGALRGAEFLLDRIAEHGAEATFFVVGELAEQYPDRVAELGETDHEIASHSHTHQYLSSLPVEDQIREYERSKEILESVTGCSVTGFRAPMFDKPDHHVNHVASSGYSYDSSALPSRWIPGWYNSDTTRQDLHTVRGRDASEPFVQLPVSVMPGLRYPISGAWMRLCGRRYTLLGLKLLARKNITPVIYVHPWELADLPRVDGVPRRVYWRTGQWMRETIDVLLSQPFEYVSAESYVERAT